MKIKRVLRQFVTWLVLLALMGGQGTLVTAAVPAAPGHAGVPEETWEDGGLALLADKPPTSLDIAGGGEVIVGASVPFTATVSPVTATLPITFTWEKAGTHPATYVVNHLESTHAFSWNVSGGQFITVTAENAAGSLTQVRRVWVDPLPLPDLTITDISYNGNYIVYQMMNTGEVTVTASHTTQLWVDSILHDSDVVSHITVAPGARVKRQFSRTSACSGLSDTFLVVVDVTGVITESNELNNERRETWSCDPTPPAITRGPAAFDVTTSGASIRWSTDEASDSVVLYGTRKGVFDHTASNAVQTTAHSVLLKGLRAGTTYQVKVQSTDAAGNTVTSKPFAFETDPPAAPPPPAPVITMTRDHDHAGVYVMAATFADASAVERVEFFLNDVLIGTDYGDRSAPASTARGATAPSVLAPVATSHASSNKFQTSFVPYLQGYSRTNFFDKPQTVTAHVYGWDRTVTMVPVALTVTSTSEPLDVDVSIDSPPSDHTIYINGDRTPAGTMVSLDVTAIQYDWACEYQPFDVEADCSEVMRAVSHVQMYLENDLIADIYPDDDQDYDYHAALDLGNRIPGSYYVKVRALDTEGQAYLAETWIEIVQRLPSLNVTREVDRFGNRFRVRLTVENLPGASGLAKLKKVEDYVRSFQVAQNHDPDFELFADYTWDKYVPDARETQITIDFPDAPGDVILLDPGESIEFEYWMVPVLYEDDTEYEIGHKAVEVTYVKLSGEQHTSAFHREELLLLYRVGQALEDANYLIVTAPQALKDQSFYSPPVDQLLMAMADLARLKLGVVGHLESSNPRDALDDLVASGGGWAAQLSPNFGTVGGGYLLIVGEEEIVPGWTIGNIDLSDQPYSDTGGSILPDLAVGRIVGNRASALLKPLQASIDVYLYDADFDRSKGWLITGAGEGQDIMLDHIATIRNILYDDVGITSDTLVEAPDYHEIDAIPFTISVMDDFTLGTLTAGTYARGLLGDASADIIRNFNPTTGVETEGIDQAYGSGDQLVAGQLLGSTDSIVMGDVSSGEIHIFSPAVDVSFSPGPYGFCEDCKLALGDVDGEGIDEVLFGYPAGVTGGRLAVYDAAGAEKAGAGFAFDFGFYDDLAAGDLTGGSADEIVIADSGDGMLRVYNKSGTVLASLALTYGVHDQLAVGNVRSGNGKAEIVIKSPGWIYVYTVNGAEDTIDMAYRMYVPWTDLTDQLAVGNVTGNYLEEIVLGRAEEDEISWLDTSYCTRFLPVANPATPESDILVYRGHGSASSWGCVTDFPSGFGDTRPFAWGPTCLSGNYEGSEDYGVAEAFFDAGGAVFVGATEVSQRPKNYDATKQFFQGWGNESIGLNFLELERSFDGLGAYAWMDWVLEYNLYGDPTFGAVLQPGLLETASPATASPSGTLTLDLPALVVTSSQGIDYVTIPGGGRWLALDEAQVPVWQATYDYPAGTRVQAVALEARSGLETHTGWVLPLNTGAIDSQDDGVAIAATLDAEDEWVTDPDVPYTWHVWDNPDGTTTLGMVVYPFFYHPTTTDSQYYRHFDFTITTTTTALTITHLSTGQNVYEPSDWVDVDLQVQNDDPALDVVVEAEIQDATGTVISGLLLRSLHDLAGPISFDPVWDSTGTAPGDYRVVVVLRDAEGHVLDQTQEGFRLGTVQGEVASLTVSPETIAGGPAFDVTLVFSNTGTVPITGTAEVTVYPANAFTATAVLTGTLSNVQPGTTASFVTVWDATGVPIQAYRLVGRVRFDGRLTAPVEVALAAGGTIYLPLVVRR